MQQLALKNKPTKSGFDLGRSVKFTAKVGEATPVGPVKVVYPGCTHKIGLQSFTRTVSVNTAAFARMREYYDFYFVPFEVLWNKFDSVITQMKDNCQHAMGPIYDDNLPLSLDLPYFTCEQVVQYLKELIASGYDTNTFGFKRSFGTVRLLSYLGYPDFSMYLDEKYTWEKYPMPNKRLSPFPLLAYQKVYADHIRFQQWEKSNPSTFNLDYLAGSGTNEMDLTSVIPEMVREYNFFDLRYFNYNKDLFFGLLPNTQYGDEAIVTLNGASSTSFEIKPSPGSLPYFQIIDGLPDDSGNLQVNYNVEPASGSLSKSIPKPLTVGPLNSRLRWADDIGLDVKQTGSSSSSSSFSILALRQAEALQRWKEVSQSVDQDYKSQIEAHFGVKVSEYLSHKSTWLNGSYGSLDINPVVNNNLIGDNQADIKGIGTMKTNGSFTFNSQDRYGIIIGLYHVTPIFDYTCGYTDPSVFLTHATDFPLPEFDRIGMEPIYMNDLCLTPHAAGSVIDNPLPDYLPVNVSEASKQDEILGYAPRYIKWKTSVDIALGGFTRNEKSWVLPFDYNNLENCIYVYENGGVSISYKFSADSFRINPKVVDTIFAFNVDDTYDTDHFRVSCFITDDTTQPLDYNGLPY